MSTTGVDYARAGFTTTLTPPRPGIYYVATAVYNALTPSFTVQNGVDQTTLSGQTAQLFAMPTSGSAMQLQPEPNNAPYGAYLGPLQSVWFGPDDTPGSFPVTLGALAGLIQWTPQVTIDASNSIYVVPGAACYAIAFGQNSDPSQVITVTGVQSGKIVGQSTAPGSTSLLVQLESGTGDTSFAITSSSAITAVLSLLVGAAPTVNAAQTIGSQQVLIGMSTTVGGDVIVVNTNPLWRAVFVAMNGSGGPWAAPVVQGSSGFFYAASTPPYLVPADNQVLYRYNILTGVDTSVTITFPTGPSTFWWGADFADTAIETYNASGGP